MLVACDNIDNQSEIGLWPFYWHGLILIPACTSNHMPTKVWDEITDPFLNFNSCTIKVYE